MATEDQLIAGLKAADAAGNTADAQHFADQIKTMRSAGPAAPPPQSLFQRVKGAVIAPVSERDKTPVEALVKGVQGIPGQIADDFHANLNQLGADVSPSTFGDSAAHDGDPILGSLLRPAMDLAGVVLSPFTGTLTSAIGRPVEQATGLRRNIVGDIASAAIPVGNKAKIAEDAGKISSAIRPMAAEAHAAGYVLPPKMISDKPGILANLFSGVSGKIKTAQAAAEKNQTITNGIAAKDLGLSPDTQLSDQAFQQVRAEAGKAYEAVKTAVPAISADDHYIEIIKSLGGANSDAAAKFPNTMKNEGIKDLVTELSSVKQFPTSAGMELVKELRSSAVANLKAIGDRSKHMLGLAQRQAADAVDGLIQRNVEAHGGDPGLVKAYTDARQLIAKSYDIEGATNGATGDVNAMGLARLASKGKPLSGGTATIAKVAQAFPQAMKAGVVSEPMSALDFFGAAALAAHGNPKLGAMMLARPVARATILSKPAQEALVAGKGVQTNALAKIRRAPAANALYQLSEQPQQ